VFVSKITPIENDEVSKQIPPGPVLDKKVAPSPVKQPPQPAAKKVKPAKTASKPGWLVRIGTFTREDNAKRIVTLLKSKGFAPKTSSIRAQSGQATRVWVGPFAKRDKAVSVRRRILKETGQQGLIVASP